MINSQAPNLLRLSLFRLVLLRALRSVFRPPINWKPSTDDSLISGLPHLLLSHLKILSSVTKAGATWFSGHNRDLSVAKPRYSYLPCTFTYCISDIHDRFSLQIWLSGNYQQTISMYICVAFWCFAFVGEAQLKVCLEERHKISRSSSCFHLGWEFQIRYLRWNHQIMNSRRCLFGVIKYDYSWISKGVK